MPYVRKCGVLLVLEKHQRHLSVRAGPSPDPSTNNGRFLGRLVKVTTPYDRKKDGAGLAGSVPG
ncbi:MAG: hypothetical protein JO308_09810 [Verrucomicrobia bacterium]|nr:hypothetical protein [Verrucomicrobiota bacterium]